MDFLLWRLKKATLEKPITKGVPKNKAKPYLRKTDAANKAITTASPAPIIVPTNALNSTPFPLLSSGEASTPFSAVGREANTSIAI